MSVVEPGYGTVGPVRLAWAPVPEAADRSAIGDALIAELLAGLGETDLRVGRRCDTCGATTHGRPLASSRDAVVSLGYAEGIAVAAAAPARDAIALGVDIERDGAAGPMPELAALFAPAPPPDLRRWTLIEAVVKADGRGFRIPPEAVRFTGIRTTALPDGERIRLPDGRRIAAASAPAPSGFLISVAIDPGPESAR